jgi:hypothetical protein
MLKGYPVQAEPSAAAPSCLSRIEACSFTTTHLAVNAKMDGARDRWCGDPGP